MTKTLKLLFFFLCFILFLYCIRIIFDSQIESIFGQDSAYSANGMMALIAIAIVGSVFANAILFLGFIYLLLFIFLDFENKNLQYKLYYVGGYSIFAILYLSIILYFNYIDGYVYNVNLINTFYIIEWLIFSVFLIHTIKHMFASYKIDNSKDNNDVIAIKVKRKNFIRKSLMIIAIIISILCSFILIFIPFWFLFFNFFIFSTLHKNRNNIAFRLLIILNIFRLLRWNEIVMGDINVRDSIILFSLTPITTLPLLCFIIFPKIYKIKDSKLRKFHTYLTITMMNIFILFGFFGLIKYQNHGIAYVASYIILMSFFAILANFLMFRWIKNYDDSKGEKKNAQIVVI